MSLCQKRWASTKRWEKLLQNKTKIVVAEEIGQGNETILSKIGWGNELGKLSPLKVRSTKRNSSRIIPGIVLMVVKSPLWRSFNRKRLEIAKNFFEWLGPSWFNRLSLFLPVSQGELWPKDVQDFIPPNTKQFSYFQIYFGWCSKYALFSDLFLLQFSMHE